MSTRQFLYLSGLGGQKTQESDLRFVTGTVDFVVFWFVVEFIAILHVTEVDMFAKQNVRHLNIQ